MVAKLNPEAFAKAREFLLTRARKLETAAFRHEFEDGPAEAVARELEAFRNADGGFGRGLEPDLRCPESSALASTTAMQLLLRLEGEVAAGPVDRTMRYFRETYSDEEKGWNIIPAEAVRSPRAIWWETGVFKEHWGNPSAEIAGYFNLFPREEDSGFAASLNEFAARRLAQAAAGKEMHEMLCYVRWARTLPSELLDSVRGSLDDFVRNCVVRDPTEGAGYGCTPLTLVDSPDSFYYKEYRDDLPAELERLIAEQGPDGAWSPNWAWGRYEDEWETARVEWQGALTLNALRTLRNFGRLA